MATPGATKSTVPTPVVAGQGNDVAARRRSHGDHILDQVTAGIDGCDRRIHPIVARGSHHHHPCIAQALQGLEFGLGVLFQPVACIHHARALGQGVVETLDRIRDGSRRCRPAKFERHDAGTPRHPGDALSVVTHGANDPRDRGAVPLSFGFAWVASSLLSERDKRIDAMHIIDVPIAIIIDPIRLLATAGLAGIAPQVRRQIGVREVGSGVDHRHRHRRGIGAQIPGFRRVDIGIHQSQILPEIIQRPLDAARKLRIRREPVRAGQSIWFDKGIPA
jgi:hypothetical protein